MLEDGFYFWIAAITIASAIYSLAGAVLAEARLRHGAADLNTLRALTGLMRQSEIESRFEKIGPDTYKADLDAVLRARGPLTRVFVDNWLIGASGALAVMGLAQMAAGPVLILAGFTYQALSWVWALFRMRELIEDLRGGEG